MIKEVSVTHQTSSKGVLSSGSLLQLDDFVGSLLVVYLRDAEGLSDRRTCNRMVEVLVLVVPLDSHVMVAIVLHGLVDRSQVLQAAH